MPQAPLSFALSSTKLKVDIRFLSATQGSLTEDYHQDWNVRVAVSMVGRSVSRFFIHAAIVEAGIFQYA